MTSAWPESDRTLDLLAARATQGLTDDERRELEGLLGADPGPEATGFELAAAALDLALAGRVPAALPEHVRQRLHKSAAGWAAPRETGPIARISGPAEPRRRERADPPGTRFTQAAGWLLAAACLVLAVLGWWPRLVTTLPADRLTAADQRRTLLAAADTVVLPWGDWDNPEIKGVTGDIVWSPSLKRGYMRLVGLPANDPARQQYQLWIVDERGLQDSSGQSARVSGAVFDGGDGEVIVPVEPAVAVGDARLFAVTIEKPGGTWVSDMSRRVVVAARQGG